MYMSVCNVHAKVFLCNKNKSDNLNIYLRWIIINNY